jgi:SSS family solute:Na+ symporter
MMRLLPPGQLGLVFAALIAAIIASTASKINSIATIFTLDVYAKRRHERTRAEDDKGESAGEEKHLVLVGRITAVAAIIIAIITARPLVGSSEQAFQYIQEFTGFFTPGITVIFLLGLFWKRANEAGAIVAAVTSVALSTIMKYTLPTTAFPQSVNDYLTPFINRMGAVFLVSLLLAVIVSLATPQRADADKIDTTGVRYKTSTGFNVGALGVILVLIALYATWW